MSAGNERVSPPHHTCRATAAAATSPTNARSAVLGSPRPAYSTSAAPNPAASRDYLQVGEDTLSSRCRASLSNYTVRVNAFRGIFVATNLKVSFTVCDRVIPARPSS